VPLGEVAEIEAGLGEGSLHPNETKRRLAREIVTLYHDERAARAAEEHFDLIHRRHEIPDDVPTHTLPPGDPVSLAALIRDADSLPAGARRGDWCNRAV
jgi:tyrosyl-tRNA synthetase